MDAVRHPSLAVLCDDIETLIHARAATEGRVCGFVPIFVWDHASVGLKDRVPHTNGTERYLMPYRVDSDPVVENTPEIVTGARLGANETSVRLPVRLEVFRAAEWRTRVLDAEHRIWVTLERIIGFEVTNVLSRLRREWCEMTGVSTSGLDPAALEAVVSSVCLGDENHTGLVPSTLEALLSTDQFTKVDPMRWLTTRLHWRTECAVRALLGDPRDGSAIRAAIATGTSIDASERHVAAALDLDMRPFLAADVDLDERTGWLPSVEDHVLSRVV